MSPETITISRADLTALAGEMARQVATVMQHQRALPTMYAFPEDIYAILKEKVPVNTIKSWHQRGLIKITKLGRYCFVKPDDWQYFEDNYPLLKGKKSNGKKLR